MHVILILFLLSLQKFNMKRYKVIDVIKLLLKDHWEYCYSKGDHRQFKHPTRRERLPLEGKTAIRWISLF